MLKSSSSCIVSRLIIDTLVVVAWSPLIISTSLGFIARFISLLYFWITASLIFSSVLSVFSISLKSLRLPNAESVFALLSFTNTARSFPFESFPKYASLWFSVTIWFNVKSLTPSGVWNVPLPPFRLRSTIDPGHLIDKLPPPPSGRMFCTVHLLLIIRSPWATQICSPLTWTNAESTGGVNSSSLIVIPDEQKFPPNPTTGDTSPSLNVTVCSIVFWSL